MKIKGLDLASKNTLVLGLGKEGISTLKFLRRKFPNKLIGVADYKTIKDLEQKSQKILEKDKKLILHLGRSYQNQLNKYDVIFKSPGVKIEKQTRADITSQTKIILESFRDKVIGITGTKGKTTTSSLIHKILQDAKFKVLLLGNIGNPPFDVIDKIPSAQYLVYELSSFQLQDLKVSPHIAVFLNLYQEHLDYHGGFDNYKNAKTNIVRWQNKRDFVVYNADSQIVAQIVKRYSANKIPFSLKGILQSNIQTKLKGRFNLNNILAAISTAKILKISDKSLASSVKTFEPVKHRLEYIGNFRGISFYNDSIATIPEATIAALETLKPNVATLIVGGYNRGVDYSQLSKKIGDLKIQNLILFPQTGKIILEGIKKKKKYMPNYFTALNMKDAVKIAARITKKGKICLMSPASSSFNLFRDYQDRGEQFIREVQKLK